MPEIWVDVDAALTGVPLNMLSLTDDTDFKTRETGVSALSPGLDLRFNFVATSGAYTSTAVSASTSGSYNLAHKGDGMYAINVPATSGASINNDTEGFGWFTGIATGILHWRGPIIGFRAAGLNSALVDAAYSATRGLAGTALPDAAADAAGGLPISDAGGFDVDNRAPSAAAITNMNTLYDGNEGFYGAYAGPRGPGVYLNDAAANTNTVDGTDGTMGNPVSTIAAAKTLADSIPTNRIYLVNDTEITLAATMQEYEFIGIGEITSNVINLGSQDVDFSSFWNVCIEGVQGGSNRIMAVGCALRDAPAAGVTTLHIFAERCGFVDEIQVDTSNDNVFDQWYSLVAGTAAPIITATGASGTISLRHGSGGVELKSLSASHNVSIETDGQVIFNADCNVNANVVLRGNQEGPIDNTAGMSSLTVDALINRTAINAEVDTALDEAIPELGVAAPTATPSIRTGLQLMYMALRNKLVTQTSGTDALEIHNDAGTKITQKLLTDDGSDYTEAKMG